MSPKTPNKRFHLSVAAGMALVAASSAAGIYLMRNSSRLAGRFVDDESNPVSLTEPALIRVGLILVGLTLIVVSVSDLMVATVSMLVAEIMRRSISLDDVGSVLQISGGAGEIAVGVVELSIGIHVLRSNQALAERLWSGSVRRPAIAASACPACGSEYDPADYCDTSAARCANCGSRLGG